MPIYDTNKADHHLESHRNDKVQVQRDADDGAGGKQRSTHIAVGQGGFGGTFRMFASHSSIQRGDKRPDAHHHRRNATAIARVVGWRM